MTSEAEIRAGLRIVTALLLTMLGFNVLSFLLDTAVGHFSLFGLGKLALFAWLCWSVYSGKIWARVFLGAVLLIYGGATLFAAFSFGGGLGAVLGVIGATELLGAVCLFVLPQVNAYLEYAAQQG
ncbi:hypothetical protein MF271_13400 [Deinococcus sp. KNUC1210]|uniref:hypothetical protein n=1 Tax=Deinococcus sp. KNUC1210 TaxID=2917691 RepID=UPI001EF113D1|nr:hypothetical protein [Deinococcus sp. KNUC1210]ULH14955.1 hypothetical protein MF271_13400 [Deinococcus sp. KNUC1210]